MARSSSARIQLTPLTDPHQRRPRRRPRQQHARSWIFPRDPEFGPKAARVLDLYARRYDDQPLRPDEYVLSADEKTSILSLRPIECRL